MKAKFNLLLTAVIVLIGLVWMLRHEILSSAQEGLAIPLPTAGPPPVMPTRVQPLQDAVTTARNAFERALEYDQQLEVTRSKPLTLAVDSTGKIVVPANVIIEEFATRQGAADVYGLGVFPQPLDANEPVWTILIDGVAEGPNLTSPSLREEASSILYVVSRRSGDILSISYNHNFEDFVSRRP